MSSYEDHLKEKLTDSGEVSAAPQSSGYGISNGSWLPPSHRPRVVGRPGVAGGLKKASPLLLVLGVLLAKSKTVLFLLKPLVGVLKIAKFGPLLGKILLTSSSMLLSIWAYAQRSGYPFAIGFVLSIFVHELGHVVAAYRLGVKVTAPVFIPFFGALILQKEAAKSTWDEAVIGIGGPVAGTLAGIALYLAADQTGSHFYMALAHITFLINLFNLMPIMPLDGGWITGAVSPYLWLIGVVGLVGLYASGSITNPFILYLVLLSFPRLWRGLRTGRVAAEGVRDVSPRQRIEMGVYYLSLCAALSWFVMETKHF